MVLLLLLQGAICAQTNPVRKILILNEVGPQYPTINFIDQGIRAALEDSPYRLEIYREYLETILFPDPANQQRFRDFYLFKYRNRMPDVIITVGPSPLKFMLETHENFFPNVPVIFCLSHGLLNGSQVDPEFTGVDGEMAPRKTIQAALRLKPDTKHVVVVGGTSAYDKQQQALVKERLRVFENRLDISYLTNLSMPDLLAQLRQLPDHTVALLTTMGKDGAGTAFSSSETGPLVVGASRVPVFSLFDVYLGHGEVGGSISSFVEQGKIAGRMARRALDGEKPQSIPIVTDSTVYTFDWRALRRWGLKEQNLPPGSIVLYREPTSWENNRRFVIGGISVILLQALLISALLLQRARRRKAEAELALTHDRLRMAVEAGRSVGWDWNPKTGEDRRFGDLKAVFGIAKDSHTGHIEDFRQSIYPDDQKAVWNAVEEARQSRNPYAAEFRVQRPDGEVRWINAKGQFYYAPDGSAERMLGIAVDITDRKRAEEMVRESEERFRLVANSAPVMIWMSGPDKLCNYFNQPWLEFTGRSLESELGNGWAKSVHPEDVDACLHTYVSAFDRRESFNMQYRIRRKDGEYRWLFDIGVPRFEPDGSFAGYIGSCIDITERKVSEEALATLNARLIDAQEEERKRIARELHDDYNQRLAVVANELEGLAEHVANSPDRARDQLQKLWDSISELSTDLHSLSHRLHSSTLENLGLVAATDSFCREFAHQQGMQIDFTHQNVPGYIPADQSLCLFRILQEGLRNIKRHSAVDRAHVRLEGIDGKLHLSIVDEGIGFDVHKRSVHKGIGIQSMEERLRWLGGHLNIQSNPTKGTRVDAWLPFTIAKQRAS